MATVPVRPTASEEGDPVKPDRPLALRLYACPHLVALVRLFGDRELSSKEAEPDLKPLYEQFGKERILNACEELLDDRRNGKTVVFRLKRDVRQLAVQILGPVPSTSGVSPAVAAAASVPQSSADPIAVPPPASPLTNTKEETAVSPPSPPNDHAVVDETTRDVPETPETPQQAISNFETFLIHFWLTGSEELCEYCMGLVEQVREDAPLCEEVTEQGWSVEAAVTHYVATDLRAFVEQEALASRTDQMHADHTRQMLDRVDWRELAESFLSDE